MQFLLSLQDKVCLVTGPGAGLAKAIVPLFVPGAK